MPSERKEGYLQPDHPEHLAYVLRMQEYKEHFKQQTYSVWKKSMDWWDLFLAQQADTRDPVDEQWRSDVFVPLPFSTTRTKAAQITDVLVGTEPIWETEASREDSQWIKESKPIERLLGYTHRENKWRKFLYKLAEARSVQGNAFFKVVWQKRATNYTFYPSGEELKRYMAKLEQVKQASGLQLPDFMTDPDGFEEVRQQINQASLIRKDFPQLGPAPILGPKPTEIIEYEGPTFQYLPMWTVYVDPMIDEMDQQPVIIHRMVKRLSQILRRSNNLPPGKDPKGLPYYEANVMAAMGGWDGQVLVDEERELAEKMGLNPIQESDPKTNTDPRVLIEEVWSADEEFKFAVIMNEKVVINKRPFERPLLTTTPNIFALRNIMLPGFFYGLSDYQMPEKLFRELNQFRRVRMDGAVLSTLPVFVKQAGIHLTEEFKKLSPGKVITLPRADAIQSLIKHALPPEAYREPPEMKAEIEDATEVYATDKGAPATVGRVTGTEFQARAQQTQLKRKIDSLLIEEELMRLPHVILGMYAQNTDEVLRRQIGGDPDALLSVTKEELIRSLSYKFRMRGATQHTNKELQIQQLTQALTQFRDSLSPVERRYGLQLIMELLDIRGWSKILTPEGEQQIGGAATAQMGATNAQNVQAKDQAEAAGVQAPGSVEQGEAAAAGMK